MTSSSKRPHERALRFGGVCGSKCVGPPVTLLVGVDASDVRREADMVKIQSSLPETNRDGTL